MATRTGSGRANALKPGQELVVRIQETSKAPAEVVYDLVADLRSHLEWAGERQPKGSFRLLEMDAPEGPATIGTEFRTKGADPAGRFTDSSVVTEASRAAAFEFVTEAHLERKKGRPVDWTNVHRYEIEAEGTGCRIAYTVRIVRLSELSGSMAAFKIPGLRALALKVSSSYARRGLRNLARLAEEGPVGPGTSNSRGAR